MKAATSLLAVLLMLSSTSLAQTAPVQEAAPTQQAAAGGESSKSQAATHEAESQAPTTSPSPTASTPSTEAGGASRDGANVGGVLAAPSAPLFTPGAKLFIAPMDGFEQTLAQSILKKKVPVVLVNESAKADFVMSGQAHVKKRGWISGMVLDTGGKGYVSITDARTGNVVFTHKFKRADSNLTEGWIYQGWADGAAKDLKKTMEKK